MVHAAKQKLGGALPLVIVVFLALRSCNVKDSSVTPLQPYTDTSLPLLLNRSSSAHPNQ